MLILRRHKKYIGYKSEPREVKAEGILKGLLFALSEQISETDLEFDYHEVIGYILFSDIKKSFAKLAIYNQSV